MATSAHSELLVDSVRFGMEMEVRQLDGEPRQRLLSKFRKRGWLAEQPAGDRVNVRVPFPIQDGVRGSLEGALFLREVPEPDGRTTLIIGDASELRLNLLESVRAEIGEEACGPPGLDGKRNVVGPTAGRCAELLERQLEIARLAIDRLTDGIWDALGETAGELVRERLWIRAVEVTADVQVADAAACVRALQRAPLPGSRGVVADYYRVSVGSPNGIPAVRWYRLKVGPVAKAYPKRSDLARFEISFAKRASLQRAGAGDATLGGDEAVELLLDLAELAGPLLGEVVAHATAAGANARSYSELVLGLAPLARLAEGRTEGPGRPPSEKARLLAGGPSRTSSPGEPSRRPACASTRPRGPSCGGCRRRAAPSSTGPDRTSTPSVPPGRRGRKTGRRRAIQRPPPPLSGRVGGSGPEAVRVCLRQARRVLLPTEAV